MLTSICISFTAGLGIAAQPCTTLCSRAPDLLQGSFCSSWGLCWRRQQEPVASELHQVPVPLHRTTTMVTRFLRPYFLMEAGLCPQRAGVHLSSCSRWTLWVHSGSYSRGWSLPPQPPQPADMAAPLPSASQGTVPPSRRGAVTVDQSQALPGHPIQTDTTDTQSEHRRERCGHPIRVGDAAWEAAQGRQGSSSAGQGGEENPRLLRSRYVCRSGFDASATQVLREFLASAVTTTSISSLLHSL